MRLLNQMLCCFSRRFDKVVFNLKLSNLVDSDVPYRSSTLPLELNQGNVKIDDMIELGNDNSVQYY